MQQIREIINQINIPTTQVTIEAKFIEVEQSSLESLGFDWTLMGGVDSVVPEGADGWLLQGTQLDGGLLHAGDYAALGVGKGSNLTRGLRFTSEVQGFGTSDDQLFSVYSVLGNYAFQTVLHAINQKTQSDVLSSPKVTTLSGESAVIEMVTEHYFPMSWSLPEVTAASDNRGASYTPSIPEFNEGEPDIIGVSLRVTPQVSPDNYTITMELEPEVREHVGWDDYSYELIIDGYPATANSKMAVISRRTIETRVIVYDGENVVLGGMIREKVSKYDDKVPFVGDLPLLGPLFRSKGENRQKVNLLVFVTARLVTPAGLPMRPNEMRGLPDFRR